MRDRMIWSDDYDECDPNIVDITEILKEIGSSDPEMTPEKAYFHLLRIFNTYFMEGKMVSVYGQVYQPGPAYFSGCN